MSSTAVIDPTEALASAPSAYLLDVREVDEWQAGHAPDAVHIPMMDLPGHLDRLPRDRRIICICRSGNRSGRITEFLRQQGFDAVNMVGGMIAWAGSGLPIVRGDGAPGTVI